MVLCDVINLDALLKYSFYFICLCCHQSCIYNDVIHYHYRHGLILKDKEKVKMTLLLLLPYSYHVFYKNT